MSALGIGLPYIDTLPAKLYRPGLVDFVEMTPEVLCRERRSGRLQLLPDKLKEARDLCGHLPIVVHGVELSIGSAHGANDSYLQLLDEFQASGLRVVGRHEVPPRHPRAADTTDPLHIARAAEITSLWRLAARS